MELFDIIGCGGQRFSVPKDKIVCVGEDGLEKSSLWVVGDDQSITVLESFDSVRERLSASQTDSVPLSVVEYVLKNSSVPTYCYQCSSKASDCGCTPSVTEQYKEQVMDAIRARKG